LDLEQRHIIKFMRIEGLTLGEIAKEFSSAYGPGAYPPPSIKYWRHQVKVGRTDPRRQHAGARPPFDDINAEILSLPRKYPFSSVLTIAESLGIPASTIYSYLIEKISFKFFTSWSSPYANQQVAAETSQTLKSVTLGA
jgi:hypothetical protein